MGRGVLSQRRVSFIGEVVIGSDVKLRGASASLLKSSPLINWGLGGHLWVMTSRLSWECHSWFRVLLDKYPSRQSYDKTGVGGWYRSTVCLYVCQYRRRPAQLWRYPPKKSWGAIVKTADGYAAGDPLLI